MTSGDLPHTHGVPLPARRLLHRGRPASRRIIESWWDVHVHRAELVPTTGPVIVAGNHIGVADGPLLAILGPRPVHALTKREMFDKAGGFFRASGQIPLDREHADPRAVKMAVAVLRDGGCVGIFPEGTRGPGDFPRFHSGAAYLALVTGAPVVPVSFFGTRDPGAGSSSVPPRGTRVDMVHGEPFRVAATPWPRTREQVDATTTLLKEHMVAQLEAAQSLTGRLLPGPLPTDHPDDGRTPSGRGA
ncbi:lysophospholipid acyltransferase family protein [Nocardioides alcanivorans]|uniref:lysophospholipid acyltransferase family protein n=1 Tax=Nocardioides alcanivorans TaxID=2897352 RepID=UPI001F424077|nr:lysophospholipid acyltransferase family protein [Nocardioides alcanivorans]